MVENNTPPSHLSEAFDALFSSAPMAVSSASARPQAAQLDNGGPTLTPPRTKEEEGNRKSILKRRQAWGLRDTAAMLLRPDDIEKRGPAVCGCGRAGFEAEEVSFHLKEDGTAKTSGVLYCDSSWLCPVCAPRRGKERQERVAEVFDHVKAYNDGQMVMCTLTVRHRRGQSLVELKKAVQAASRMARQGAPWSRAKRKFGVFGVVSAPEVTWSPESGWHFHIHTAIVHRGTDKEAQSLGEWFVHRYMGYVEELGYSALIDGQDVSVIRDHKKLADYISKGVSRTRELAWEMAGQATKKARSKGGLHPFDILEKASGDDQMKALFREYADAMKGVRSCVVTKSLADALDIEPADDAEKKGERPPEPDAVGTLPTFIWNKVMNKMKGGVVLSILEDGGSSAWADARSAAYDFAEWGFDDSEGAAIERRPISILHEPTADEIAREIRSYCSMKRNKGQAVKMVLDQHREFAKARGLTFVVPPMKKVLDLLAA